MTCGPCPVVPGTERTLGGSYLEGFTNFTWDNRISLKDSHLGFQPVTRWDDVRVRLQASKDWAKRYNDQVKTGYTMFRFAEKPGMPQMI